MPRKRRLGRTDIYLSSIGLGCWQFAGGGNWMGHFWPDVPQETANEIVHASLSGGIDWFDTAEAYGNGRSERALSEALEASGAAADVVAVATKWWPFPRTARSIKRTVGDRLQHLSPFPIDLHQIHQPYAFSRTRSQMDAMADLLQEGVIRAVGVSNFSERKMRKAHEALQERGFALASNQVSYSLIDRRIERNGVLNAAKELGISIIAYSPLGQGILTGKFHEDPALIKTRGIRRFMAPFRKSGLRKSRPVIDALHAVAEAHDTTSAQVALAWLIQYHGDSVVAIPGASKVEHVADNVGAMELELSRGELDRIEEASRPFV